MLAAAGDGCLERAGSSCSAQKELVQTAWKPWASWQALPRALQRGTAPLSGLTAPTSASRCRELIAAAPQILAGLH